MTPQEQQLLQGLTDRVNQTVLSEKDPEAEQFLVQSLSRNPDALYILAQTVLVQQYALDNAKKQLDDTKQQLDVARQQQAQPAKHTSFLGGLLGHDEPRQPSAPPPPPPQQQQYSQQQYAPVPNYPPPAQYGQPQYGQPQYGQPQYGQSGFLPAAPGGGSGFLGSALRTAGMVGAGALAFEGVESLMHGFGEHAGYGSDLSNFGGGGMGMGQPREEVINNYYGDDRGGDDRGLSRDIEDRRDDDRASFADTSDTDSGSDDTSADNTDFGMDDSSGSSSDDFGGSDFGSDNS